MMADSIADIQICTGSRLLANKYRCSEICRHGAREYERTYLVLGGGLTVQSPSVHPAPVSALPVRSTSGFTKYDLTVHCGKKGWRLTDRVASPGMSGGPN